MKQGWILGASLFLAVAGVQAQSVSEAISSHLHLGVASCANSVCHGATETATKASIQMNEFAVWQEFDPHAKSYQTLLSAESKSIAKKLGLGAAEQAGVCLDCHADHVPAAQRGEKFQIEDGVGCEACHGGAEPWIASHVEASHAENLTAGLYPTEDPVKRSALCLSCHAGSRDRMITHRIMGAGHPRLSFELDTFTWLHPHYTVDDDYEQRKGNYDGVRDWGVGQASAAINALDILLDPKAGWHGIFPELVLFDCHACHRPMSGKAWGPRQGTGLGPGVVRLNDANLLMFRHVLAAVDSNAAKQVFDGSRKLHQATTTDREQTLAAARALRERLMVLRETTKATQFPAESLGVILGSLVADAERGEFRDYAAAEQAAMAVQSVVVAFEGAGLLDEAATKRMQQRVDALYASIEKDESWSMLKFTEALRAVRAAAP
ncbi:MAG TPA: multiheme c-type cytochrome [Pseudomonadota bacterium]|nr:hypothetical protein [Xanthomonadales bacterium]HQW80906.1 multiheme c-type cytochrome [Pseudomonadota bacterium]